GDAHGPDPARRKTVDGPPRFPSRARAPVGAPARDATAASLGLMPDPHPFVPSARGKRAYRGISARVAENIRLKRIYDPPSEDDGYRVLSTRYWPRGVPKSAVDDYTTKTAPSRALLREFKHEGLAWEDYVPLYLDEMQSEEAKSAIKRLAE